MLRVAATSALGVMQHAAAPSVVIAGTNALLRHGPAWSVQQGLFARFAASNAPTTSAQQATVDTPPKVVPHPSLLSGTAVKAQSSLEGQAVLPIVDPDVAKAMALPVYDMNYLLAVKPYHVPPVTKQQKVAYNVIQTIRRAFDLATGYGQNMTEARWLRRMVFLETVAGVPGMVAGMLRHLRSLRLMRRDNGWINTLLAEAENERMHLLTFMELRKPGPLFRGMVLAAQGVMFNALFCAYLASPKTVHAMVGYLEEEAVRTYTHALQDIDAGKLWPGKPAPAFAKQYWRLAPDATMRDLILVVRADEACHSHVNHTFSKMKGDEPNPFGIGSHQVP